MKKAIILLSILSLLMLFSGCLREEAPTPDDMFGPSTAEFVLSLTATPSVIKAQSSPNSIPNTSVVRARLYHFKKGALPNRSIVFYIDGYSAPYTPPEGYTCYYNSNGMGNINGSIYSVKATTDANGVASVVYYPPLRDDIWLRCSSEDGSVVYYVYPDEVTIYIKAYYKGQPWPGGVLADVEGITPIKVVK